MALAAGLLGCRASPPLARTIIEARYDPAAAVAIGRAWLQQLDGVPSAWHLLDQAFGASRPGEIGRLFQQFEDRVRADFLVGDTVMVEQWMLSRSEVSLYAALALEAAAI